MLRNQFLKACFVVGFATAICSLGHAQTEATRVLGPLDSEVVIPARTGVLGRVDPTALEEIVLHLKVVGSAPWTGMQPCRQNLSGR